MRVVVSGEVHVHYGQIYVESNEGGCGPDLHDAFTGQPGVGLCGGGVDGALFLLTGLHTGAVGFRVEVHDARPSPDEAWEEIVEVPFRPASDRTLLMQWAGEAYWDVALEQCDYRVRYSAVGFDAGRELDTRVGKPQADRYLLQFWPAEPEPARLLKETGSTAGYWHAFANRLT